MKHGKRPTRYQRKFHEALGINTENWLVVKDMPDNMVIVHKLTGQQRSVEK